MKTEEQIAKDFGCGYDCAMQVAAELAPEVGLTEEQGLKIAACLGVGAMQGQLCGAVIGALIAIGYKYGNTVRDDMATKGACLAKRGGGRRSSCPTRCCNTSRTAQACC